jgi:uncharacterized pyridoxamine 5'-phosphate oxidase family protein
MDCSKNHQLRITLYDEFRPCYTHLNRSVAFRTSCCARNAGKSALKKGDNSVSVSDVHKIVSIMKDNYLYANLATCDGDQPRVRIVSPLVEDDMSIWVTTRSTSRKVKQLRENPRICLAFIEPPDGDRAVTVIGEAQIIPDVEKKSMEVSAIRSIRTFPRWSRLRRFLPAEDHCQKDRMERDRDRRSKNL